MKKMAWSKCAVRIGKTGSNDAMAASASMKSPGTVKDKSAVLEPEDGDTMEAKATGGELVGFEELEGGANLTYRIIEPDDELYTLLGLGEADAASKEFKVKTHVVEGDWSVEVSPKNVGAKGIRAPKTHITFKPGWSEEEGNYVDITHKLLFGEVGYWYSRFVKEAAAAGA